MNADVEDEEFKDKDGNKNSFLAKLGKINFTKKGFWIVVLIYSTVVLTLKYKFNSKVGEFLYQLSYFALISGVIVIGY